MGGDGGTEGVGGEGVTLGGGVVPGGKKSHAC